jgi:hypothetical protein
MTLLVAKHMPDQARAEMLNYMNNPTQFTVVGPSGTEIAQLSPSELNPNRNLEEAGTIAEQAQTKRIAGINSQIIAVKSATKPIATPADLAKMQAMQTAELNLALTPEMALKLQQQQAKQAIQSKAAQPVDKVTKAIQTGVQIITGSNAVNML